MEVSLKAPPQVHVVLQARSTQISDLIEACAKREIDLGTCCERIAAMGYKTTSVYEMVRAAEYALKQDNA